MIAFFVEGEPRAKQSFRVAGRGRGFTHPRVKAWQNMVAWVAQIEMFRLGRVEEPLTGNLSVELTFFLPNAKRVDSDNLAKCVLDGLNGSVFVDDKQTITLTVNKYICRQKQGVLIRIAENNRHVEVSLDEMNLMIELANPTSRDWSVALNVHDVTAA